MTDVGDGDAGDAQERFMRRALRLAKRAAGRTSPNPMVGAVIVAGDEIVGEGFHRAAGEPHAEINALRAAGERARGATLYLTLEPCSHRGRTPPCVDAVIGAGIARVVAALRDPYPKVNGRGFRALRQAGIRVDEGMLADEAARLNEGFLTRMRSGRPFVLLKLATTIDGRAAVAGRRYLSGKRALREVHALRDRLDAVLVGIGTILADDPALTVREQRGRDPLRVVVDTEGRTPTTSKIVRSPDPQRTVIFVAREADPRRTNRLRGAGVSLVRLPRTADGLDLRAVLKWLGDQGVNSVLAEGGPRIAGSLLGAGLVDKVLFLVAPVIGGDGPTALKRLAAASGLRDVKVRRLGQDIAISAYLARSDG
ncbi:MAG: bifunctional diaminohydroxyphosphoribosylaminopyrimidine deaminase/5-amino-6-(5-phosphoribosylamino)uracil reductase RibD [Chloroflexota bacterium]|nr:bifunctional diaminohydroxyphosphoribosylaminopyrimidine deaminase/5-amino-6-(5-phosphoribosylamino)uracil reductase RibD [Chloroflexota bacterium]